MSSRRSGDTESRTGFAPDSAPTIFLLTILSRNWPGVRVPPGHWFLHLIFISRGIVLNRVLFACVIVHWSILLSTFYLRKHLATPHITARKNNTPRAQTTPTRSPQIPSVGLPQPPTPSPSLPQSSIINHPSSIPPFRGPGPGRAADSQRASVNPRVGHRHEVHCPPPTCDPRVGWSSLAGFDDLIPRFVFRSCFRHLDLSCNARGEHPRFSAAYAPPHIVSIAGDPSIGMGLISLLSSTHHAEKNNCQEIATRRLGPHRR